MSQDVLFEAWRLADARGRPGGSLYIIAEGEFEVTQKMGARDDNAVRGRARSSARCRCWNNGAALASVRALKPTRAIMISHDDVDKLLATSPSAALALFHTMTRRVRSNEALLRPQKKWRGWARWRRAWRTN